MTPEQRQKWLAGRTTHGAYANGKETSTHAIWRGMVARCCNKNAKDYPRYGGLGVQVCARWRAFDLFLADMGERPEGLELDRYPDTWGDYEPGNCRWATHSEQQRNKRSTRLHAWEEENVCLEEWSRRAGISKQLAFYRLKQMEVRHDNPRSKSEGQAQQAVG
jgi:hypothetical protein